jgi:hypothetical protein
MGITKNSPMVLLEVLLNSEVISLYLAFLKNFE